MDPAIKKMSSKKKKRLKRYIEKKIKKEERVMLIEKLSKSSFSSELMKSSKNLGRRKETMKERLRKAHNEKRLGLPQSDLSVPLFANEKEEDEEEEEEEEKEDHMIKGNGTKIIKDNSSSILSDSGELSNDQKIDNRSIIVGSALKRAPDGEFTVPIKKKKKKIKKKKVKIIQKSTFEEDSFDSSDSQYDTDKETKNSDAAISEKLKEQSFKQWAADQMGIKLKDDENKNTIHEPSIISQSKPTNLRQKKKDVEKQGLVQDGIDITLGSIDDNEKIVKKAFYIQVKRNQNIQEARMELPVCAEEQIIMETISNNPVVIICGETGSGKTTQVPQFLYEAGYGNKNGDNPGIIGITQPRRVAAVSMSKRVAQELSLSEQEVSYQIRYDASVSPKTVIKFMTDGVLLRELANDFLLSKYSAIIIDEAHERSLNTDILIGAISRVLKLRAKLSKEDGGKIRPIKIIIMSATLRVSDFTQNKNLFDIAPPVINVNTRQFPVSIHFNKRTPNFDYASEAFKKVCKIHTKLPHGGILVFLTGQNEITLLCNKLRRKFPYLMQNVQHKSKQILEKKKTFREFEQMGESLTSKEADLEIEDLDIGNEELEDIELLDTDSEDFEENLKNDEMITDKPSEPLYVLPLYSLLSTHAQLRVFESPPEGTRLCVVATNVAETSLTIPGIKYVVDCGKVKERRYDVVTGVQSYVVDWTSKASADQRAGRAGRTGPGHCYRLFSSAVFNDQFQQYTIPEIHRMPIEGVVLQMKAMNIDTVYNFPFPTPPDRDRLRKAEKLLQYMNALDDDGRITELGRTMATFPIAPRFSKMLIIGQQHDCLPYIIAIVSALSVVDPFIKDYHLENSTNSDDDMKEEEYEEVRSNKISEGIILQKEQKKLIRKKFYDVQRKHAGLDPTSDLLKLLNVVGAYEYEGGTDKFCESNFVRLKAMEEIRKLRRQITNIIQMNCPGVDVCLDPKMKPPSTIQLKAIRQVITAGFIDQIAIRKGLIDKSSKIFSSTRNVEYCTMWGDDDVFIHPTSILYHDKPPDFVVYQELHKTSKVWMKGVTAVESSWLSKLGRSLCTFSKPVELPMSKSKKNKDTEKFAYVIPSFGPKNWELPPMKIMAQKVNGRWIYGSI